MRPCHPYVKSCERVMGEVTKLKHAKSRIFKFLHNPNTKWSHLYHSLVATIFCTWAIMITFYQTFEEFEQKFGNADGEDDCDDTELSRNITMTFLSSEEYKLELSNSANYRCDTLLITMDCILCDFLLIELCLRLWSSTYIEYYDGRCMKGLIAYFRAYIYQRALDIIGILLFCLSIIVNMIPFNPAVIQLVRILQVLQIFQANRILFPYMRVICHTIFSAERQYLLFTLLLAFTILTISSVIIFLTEKLTSSQINTLFESFWFTYETFTSIGFGDVVVNSWISKICTCFLGVIGVCSFALPANIIGTSLAIKMQEDYTKTLKYRKAVRLIQTFWRCRISATDCARKKANCMDQWQTIALNSISLPIPPLNGKKHTIPKWTDRDLICIDFIFRLKYNLASYRFKRQNMNISSYTDVSQQYAELWQRIDYIESDLSMLSNEIYDTLHSRMEELRLLTNMLQMKIARRYNFAF